jgi:predicted acetyltransferase
VDITVRPIAPEEFDVLQRAIASGFSEVQKQEWIDSDRTVAEFDRSFAALDGDAIVGGATTNSFRLSVPGGVVPMAGVTGVGVAPTHRRRGVATALMRHQLDHIRERGEPLAGLYASEEGIYGRYGYGLATLESKIEIERERTEFVWSPVDPGRVRLVPRSEAFDAIGPVSSAVWPEQPGMIERARDMWEVFFHDFEEDRDGASEFFYAVHDGPGAPDAFAVYRFKHEWPEGMPAGSVLVEDLLATTPDAYANMWRYLFDIDLAARIKAWRRPIDDPLLSLLREPRRLRATLRDGMWLRVVDVPGALSGRRYSGQARLVLEIEDLFCPWNDGRYELDARAEGAECRRTDAEPDLRLGASELASAYLGGLGFGHLARAGRIVELRPGSLSRADALFRPDRAPWSPNSF